jgi:hypothetical protein
MNKFEREIVLVPAYDKRHKDPKKNYGIHGVELRFYLKKDNRAIQFVLNTNWQLPSVTNEMLNKYPSPKEVELLFCPVPYDLGYHSPVPMYDGQEPISDNCEITGGDCYYDGSTLAAENIYKILLYHGSDGVWKELERVWRDKFERMED